MKTSVYTYRESYTNEDYYCLRNFLVDNKFRSPNILPIAISPYSLSSICFSHTSIDIGVIFAQGHKLLALNLFKQFVQHFRTEI